MSKRMLKVSLIICVILSGCQSKQAPIQPSIVSTTETTRTVTPQIFIATTAITPSPTLFDPKITNNEALTTFFRDNGNCEMPCLFGITPGISDQPSVNSYISYFKAHFSNSDSTVFDANIKGYSFTILHNYFGQVVSLSYYKDNAGIISQLVLISWPFQILNANGESNLKIIYESPSYSEVMKFFSLSNVLTVYGIPSQILIAAFPTDPDYPNSQYHFDFVLFYPDKGFLIQYMSLRTTSGDFFTGCPTKSQISVSSWIPGKNYTLLDAIQYFSDDQSINPYNMGLYFKQIQDVTTLNVEEFYRLYQNPDYSQCINSPQNLWTKP